MTDDLVTWLRAQLDEDERVAQMATLGPWVVAGRCSGEGCAELADVHSATNDVVTSAREEPCCIAEDAEHIARHDPARVLAEVDADRRILDLYEQTDFGDFARRTALEDVIRLRALPHVDRPGYRDEWRPA